MCLHVLVFVFVLVVDSPLASCYVDSPWLGLHACVCVLRRHTLPSLAVFVFVTSTVAALIVDSPLGLIVVVVRPGPR